MKLKTKLCVLFILVVSSLSTYSAEDLKVGDNAPTFKISTQEGK